MYSAEVLDHFEHPRNAGKVAASDASVRIENPACGDILELTIKLNGDYIEDVRFLARGCVASMACASALTEIVKGKAISDARRVSREELVQAVGGLPQASTHAAHLALDALSAALDQIAKKI